MANRTVMDDTLFDSQNAAYAQAMFEEYARNPEGVADEWRKLFENGATLAIAEGLLVPDQLNDHRPAPPSPVETAPAAVEDPPVTPQPGAIAPTEPVPPPPTQPLQTASAPAPPAGAEPASAAPPTVSPADSAEPTSAADRSDAHSTAPDRRSDHGTAAPAETSPAAEVVPSEDPEAHGAPEPEEASSLDATPAPDVPPPASETVATSETATTADSVATATSEAPAVEAEAGSATSPSHHLLRLLPAVSRATALIQSFRDHGHQLAAIDPLGSEPAGHPQLSPAFYGTSTEELSQLPASLILHDEESNGDRSVADALADLGDVYAGSIGYEFEHLDDHVKVQWLWEQVEEGTHLPDLSPEERRAILRRISETEGLEQFLHRTYLGQKRFSLEGNDMLVPMLDLVIEEAGKAGAKDVVLGMAHRGRLNVLTHTVGVSYGELLAEFEGPSVRGGQLDVPGTGDVKYHHGARGSRDIEGAGTVRVTLAPNPSHLEFVNPVVIGMARALQLEDLKKGDKPDHNSVVPVLMHGDAAFAAEGVVAETLNMKRLEGYTVGGTIHIIVNNQVGFTTDPKDGRSTFYSSDLAKGYGIPIIHVNADDPEACLGVIRFAMAYRRKFHDDFVIDLVGYRRHGHNEGDEPAYTQPVKYRTIASHPTVQELYSNRLIDDGVVTDGQVAELRDEIMQALREVQDRVREFEPVVEEGVDEEREVVVIPETTGVSIDILETINDATVAVPAGFSPHPKLWRQLGRRASVFSPNRAVDWGHAETLAFGSLIMEGIPVRLTGQDAQRGTFSHRHVVLHDSENGEKFLPLAALGDAPIEVYNSPLTETAVIGFEYGYSVASDKDVVLWEAQFGDFVNVAQVMIDQFLASGLTKWGQYSRLTLLLPHGHEGMGPEHSSARLERFLQLCAEDNMRVTYPTTPAQYFHMLRRQALRRPERPMIVMTPKSLLRHPKATSTVAELTEGGFRHVLPDPSVEDPAQITRLVLCSGKVYYDIQAHARRDEAPHVAVGRMELLYPFPVVALEELIGLYPNLAEVVWAQEEPRNMGGLTFVGPRLRGVVPRKIPLSYSARPERASPAEGKAARHAEHQAALVVEALGLEPEEVE